LSKKNTNQRKGRISKAERGEGREGRGKESSNEIKAI